MRVLWALLLFAMLATAARPPRSACTRQTHGRLWPEEANANRSIALELMRSGEVYLCSYGRLHYRWEPLSINVSSLKSKETRPNPEPPDPESGSKDSLLQDTP